jgi:hypothetical protein
MPRVQVSSTWNLPNVSPEMTYGRCVGAHGYFEVTDDICQSIFLCSVLVWAPFIDKTMDVADVCIAQLFSKVRILAQVPVTTRRSRIDCFHYVPHFRLATRRARPSGSRPSEASLALPTPRVTLVVSPSRSAPRKVTSTGSSTTPPFSSSATLPSSLTLSTPKSETRRPISRMPTCSGTTSLRTQSRFTKS